MVSATGEGADHRRQVQPALVRSDPDVLADMRHVGAVLRSPVTHRLLDFDEPVGLLMTASLYYLPDADEAAAMVARYKSLLAPGSHIVLSHTTLDQRQRDMLELGAVLEMTKSLTSSATARSREWIAAVLDGLEVLDPGLVYPSCWRHGERVTRLTTVTSSGRTVAPRCRSGRTQSAHAPSPLTVKWLLEKGYLERLR